MNDFDFEVKERRQLARAAKYKKNGSKSKKCSLPSDRLTPAQLRRLNGPVYIYNLNTPVTWADFKAMSPSVQKEYVSFLIENYGTTATDLGDMMGVTAHTLTTHLKSSGSGITFRRGQRMTSAQRERWDKFIAGEDCNSVEEPSSEEEPPAEDFLPAPPQPSMSLTQFTLSFEGAIDPLAVANSIRRLIGDESAGTIQIICNISPGACNREPEVLKYK